MTCLSTYWNHFWKKIWKRGHLRRIFKILQVKMMTYRMRRCLNLNVSKFWYNNCWFNSFISLNSLVHSYFFKFIYIVDRFYFRNTTRKRSCLPFWTHKQFLQSPSRSPRLPSYAENVAIAMLNIEDSDPNEESWYSSKINLQCIGVQIYIDDEAKDSFMSNAISDE